MEMIEEAYVTLETAELLRDLGFDEITTRHFYNGKPDTCTIITKQKNSDEVRGIDYCSRPTQQMVLDWLVVKHKVSLEVGWKGKGWGFQIVFMSGEKEKSERSDYPTRREATEEGLMDVLKKYV